MSDYPALLIDTSQSALILSLLLPEGRRLDSLDLNPQIAPNQHASRFFPVLEELLAQAKLGISDIRGLALNTGPGSFTGLRVGLTFARMFVRFATQPIGCAVLNPFELFAATSALRGKRVMILMNAYRGQHYQAVLSIAESGEMTWLQHPETKLNAEFSGLGDSEACVLDESMQTLLPLEAHQYVLSKDLMPSIPEAMQFLLTAQSERFHSDASVLLPNYMQQPHITVSKSAVK